MACCPPGIVNTPRAVVAVPSLFRLILHAVPEMLAPIIQENKTLPVPHRGRRRLKYQLANTRDYRKAGWWWVEIAERSKPTPESEVALASAETVIVTGAESLAAKVPSPA